MASVGTIQGTLYTVNNTVPLADYAVFAINTTDGALTNFRRTDSSGAFSFTYLPTGTYWLAYQDSVGVMHYYPDGDADSSSAQTVTVSANGTATVTWNQYSALPLISIWPGDNAVGSAHHVGNPTAISITIDNLVLPLSSLDVGTLQVMFDSIDVTAAILAQPASHFVVDGNKVTVNLDPIALPPGTHGVTVSMANQGATAATTFQQMEIDDSLGYQIGFHRPPVEDWVSPFNDWAVSLDAVNTYTSRQHTLIGYFTSWAANDGTYTEFNSFLNEQIASLGAVPVVTWEPWRDGGGSSQSDYTLSALIQGNHDVFIRRYAQDVIAYGKPIILRMMHEFNGVYYPWAGATNGNDPSLFIQAFRHIVDVFRAEGANNAQFMWSPNYTADARVPSPSNNIESYYPGDDYVDWIGVSGYNWGTDIRMQAQGWLWFRDIFDSSQFGSFLTTMAVNHPAKKVIIAEIGCNDGDATHSKAQWIQDAYGTMALYGNVGGVVWFNNTAVHDAAGLTADFRMFVNSGDTSTPSQTYAETYRTVTQ